MSCVLTTAIFRGTFDPVHLGHSKMGCSVLEQFKPEKLIIVPNANPPHKRDGVNTDFTHRYNMLKCAFENEERVMISDYESDESKSYYSLYTMRHFRRLYGENTAFIIGADSLCTIHLWHKHQEFLKENTFIVFHRENDDEFIKVFNHYKNMGIKLYMADMPFYDMSSTYIRSYLYSGVMPEGALCPEVEEYIRKNALYNFR